MDALATLLDSTREAVSGAERRARPLEPNERIDPNRADAEELDRLPGVGPVTARAIVSTRQEHGAFREAAELLSVPGIGEATLAKIERHLDFARRPVDRRPRRDRGTSPRPPRREHVDLNRADTALLQTLPGIGPALARRIIEARAERLFLSADDLERVRGIGPATVERLRPLVRAGAGVGNR